MKDQFVTYEIAVKLKELGFDKRCIAGYSVEKSLRIGEVSFQSEIDGFCLAPLWQQAIDWIYSKTPEGFKCVSYITDKKLLAENIMAELYLMGKFLK